MKTLYLECTMGAAGDMLAAALLELHPDPDGFVERLNRLALPGVQFRRETAVKCGITGTHLSVTVHGQQEESLDCGHPHPHVHDHPHDHPHGPGPHPPHDWEPPHEHPHGPGPHPPHDWEPPHEHPHGPGPHPPHDWEHPHDHPHHHPHQHHGMADIARIVAGLELPGQVREDVLAVYQLIAQAESHAHGRPVEQIHFHEVGTLDAVADITAVCLLMRELAPEQVVASPVAVGGGQVRCAHGVLPVPAPATAWLLRGVPTVGGPVPAELCTPTGAALLRHFVSRYGPQPAMTVEQIGYGMGTKDFPQANCLRAMLGRTIEETAETEEQVWELRCNLDDMTPEQVAFAVQALRQAGALEVYTTAVGMKKDRPGLLLTLLCREEQREPLTRLLFRHTTTLGVRSSRCSRAVLTRRTETVETEAGPVRVKVSSGWGVTREKPEYDDLARIAEERGCSLEEAARLVRGHRGDL